jgi:hypothetical protein
MHDVLNIADALWPSSVPSHAPCESCWHASPCLAVRASVNEQSQPFNQPLCSSLGCGAVIPLLQSLEEIWLNQTDSGPRYNVSFSRIYKTEKGWESSSSFGRDELPLVSKVADMAHKAMAFKDKRTYYFRKNERCGWTPWFQMGFLSSIS